MREGWDRITLLEACELITCGVAARPKYVDDGIPFLSAKNVKEGQIIYAGYNCITEETHQELTKKNKPLVGDILYTRVGSYGEAAVIEEDIEFSVFVSLTLIKPKKALLNSYFLKYYLNSHEIKTLAKNSITSSGVGNLNVGTVRKFPIPIPPLTEQKQIVALLDKAFAAINQAKANIERNIENARELLDSYKFDLLNKFTESEFVEFASVVKLTRGHNPPKKDFISEPKNGYVRFYQIRDGASDQYQVYVPDTPKLHLVEEDEILMVAYRHIGRAFRGVKGAFNVALCKITNLDKTKLNDDFLFELIPSPFIRGELLKISERSLIPSMSVKELAKLRIPLPSINEQERLVVLFEKINRSSNTLLNEYQRKIDNLEELKKSILQKAFAGELS